MGHVSTGWSPQPQQRGPVARAGGRLSPPMRAWLKQPHGRRHKAPPQPCALTTSAPDDPQQTRDAGSRRTTETRDILLSSAAQLRARPRLPHLAFSSSDEKRQKPPARAASRSTKGRESRSALLAPAVDWEGHLAPQSRPERPGSREQEPRLTCNARRCTVCFRRKCDVLAVLLTPTPRLEKAAQ